MIRIWNVVRMQYVNRQTFIWVPLLVLVSALLITLAIYAIIRSAAGEDIGPLYGGGAQAPLWPFAIAGAQALTMTFPFSQAMSVTRREFHIGTLLTAATTAVMLGGLFILGGLLEQATTGWWMNGYFFYIPWIWEGGPLTAGLFFFAVALLFFIATFLGATIYKRWGTTTLVLIVIAFAVLIVGVVWLVTWLGTWAELFSWFGAQGAAAIALWQLVAVAVLALISFLTLRRAVP